MDDLLTIMLAAYIIISGLIFFRIERENYWLMDKLEELGYDEDSVDRDNDGVVQEGTIFERKIK